MAYTTFLIPSTKHASPPSSSRPNPRDIPLFASPTQHPIYKQISSPLFQKHAQNLFVCFLMPAATTWIEAYIVSHTTAVT